MCFIVSEQVLTTKLPIQWLEYNLDAYHESLFSDFGIKKPAQLSTWIIKRQAQFLAGRISAKKSLPDQYKQLAIGIGNHREPLWPKGLVGSISHDNNVSIAASQQTHVCGGVGIDLQSLFDSNECNKSFPHILSTSDHQLFKRGLTGFTNEQLITLIFSAKECFFKAIFNQVGDFFDFNVVSIQSINSRLKTISITNDRQLSDNLGKGQDYTIDYKWINKNTIITTLKL